MTCQDALHAMLEADADELALRAPSPLAAHLGTCARCAAVAARLGADTAALGRAIRTAAATADGARRPRNVRIPALAVAGALAIAVMLRTPAPPSQGPDLPGTVGRAPSAIADRAADLTLPAAPVAGAFPEGTARPAADRRGGRAVDFGREEDRVRQPRALFATAFVAAPVTPVRLDSAGLVVVEAVVDRAVEAPNLAASARTPEIIVRPPTGTRALVARTADPRISVVWLY